MKPCCTDHKGKEKKKYKTKDEAERVAQLRRDDGIGIKVYECEDKDGWHLTSRNAPPPIRPKNVMTQEERALYTGRRVSRLGDLLEEEVASDLKQKVRKNTLNLYKRKIENLKQDLETREQIIRRHRQQLAILRKELQSAEEDYRIARREIISTEREYERAKVRINK